MKDILSKTRSKKKMNASQEDLNNRTYIAIDLKSFYASVECLERGLDPLTTVLSGGLLFGAVYMATDYVTSPLNRWAQIVYAIGIGVIVVIIRKFGAYPEGVTYAILLMNIAAPLLDRVMPQKIYGCRKARKEAK